MSRFLKRTSLAICSLWAAVSLGFPEGDGGIVLKIDTASPGREVSPLLFGAFFEDINYGADGGLYPELVQDRSFESPNAASVWTAAGGAGAVRLSIVRDKPLGPSNPHYAHIEVLAGGAGIANRGYDGMSLAAGDAYEVSAYLRSDDPEPPAVSFVLDDGSGGSALAEARASGLGPGWKRFDFEVLPARETTTGSLELLASKSGSFDADMVSVYPRRTYMDKPNGLRPDLAQEIASLRPGFLRFPGGCVVEGRTTSVAYRWKDTIGDIATRKENENVWGYRQSYGLGFYEYLQFCEDIGAEPLPVVNCGMACQVRGGDEVALADLGPWVQDALDLVEYANGGADSPWGGLRAASGHPAPFGLKYLGIGNEQWGSDYYDRYQVFARALKAEHPELKLVFAAGPLASGAQFDDAWREARSLGVDLVDEHYYMSPEWFLENTRRYDDYDRSGPKVFVGEYAAQESSKSNDLYAALAEAAFMTGLERNGDVVELASYAPLLARAGHNQWAPDLIWFDGSRVYGSPSYYVQSLFSRARSAATLPYSLDIPASVSRRPPLGGGVGLGTWKTRADFRGLKVTGADGRTLFEPAASGLRDWQPGMGMWKSEGGVISQKSGFAADCRLVRNAEDWRDYSLELQACKRSGDEGVMIMFGIRGQDFYRWNLGGWGGTASAVEKGTGSSAYVVGGSVPFAMETDRWYDVKVELEGGTIRCYLDGKLIHELRDVGGEGPVYAHAGRGKDGSYIVKLVNLDPSAREVRVELDNTGRLSGRLSATVLTGPGREAVNTFADPRAVYPTTKDEESVGADFSYTLEPNSLTVLRISPRKE